MLKKAIKTLLVLLFICLTTTLFLAASYLVFDKNSEVAELVTSFIQKSLGSTTVLKVDQFLANVRIQQYDTAQLDLESEEELIPLIHALSEKKTADGSVIAEEFLDQGIMPETNPTHSDINKIPENFADQTLSKDDVLDDKLNRLPMNFKISPDMRNRIGFWLDIYTKYTSHYSLIHDGLRPWIIYKIVDAKQIFDRPGSRVTQLVNEKNLVIKERAKVLSLLKKLSKQSNFKDLSPDEDRIFKCLNEIPGKRQKVIKAAIQELRVQKGQKDFFKSGVIESSKYINEMEQIFAHYNLPVELVRLPLVESSFNSEAQSKVGASGIWQFMPSVGKHYLKMEGHLDERNSPIKSTVAAAKLLQSNFKMLKVWPLAITAYNHGAGGLLKASKQLESTSIGDIITKYKSKSFSFASQNFYSEFMAALYGEKYQDEIFGNFVKHPPLAADQVILKRKTRIKDIAEIAGVTIEEIRLHNPDLKETNAKGNPYLPQGYTIRLPLGRAVPLEIYFEKSVRQKVGLREKKSGSKSSTNNI